MTSSQDQLAAMIFYDAAIRLEVQAAMGCDTFSQIWSAK